MQGAQATYDAVNFNLVLGTCWQSDCLLGIWRTNRYSTFSSLQGFVYVKFATITAAEAAQKALHGRWFAGKQICAEFQLQAMYRQHFGE